MDGRETGETEETRDGRYGRQERRGRRERRENEGETYDVPDVGLFLSCPEFRFCQPLTPRKAILLREVF